MMPLQIATAAPWRLGAPGVLLLLLAVPLVALLLWAAFRRSKRALELFAGQTPQQTAPSSVRAGIKNVLLCAGLSFVVVALARPQADPEEETVSVRGRDVVFLVDVSRSMLSKDAVPNRLGRAKLWINDLVNTLQGDRVGLVAFAGVPVVKSPLTMDYGFFRMALDELGPSSVPRGGTLIGDAIRKAMSDVFEPGPGRFRDIVLISDGEDQGSFPQEAAKQAAEQGVRLIVIGIGSEVEGVPVPAEERDNQRYLEYHGERVRSKMEGTTLAAIAEAAASAGGEHGGGGVFLNVGTGTINLDKVYHDLAGSAEQRETETKSNVTYRELFPYFLIAGAVCLVLESFIRVRVPVRKQFEPLPVRAGVLAMVLAGMLLTPRTFAADSPPPSPKKADGATPAGESAAGAAMVAPRADDLYNKGREAFLGGKFDEAAELFRKADLESSTAELSARARYNLGQSLLKQATAAQGQKTDPEKLKQQLGAAAAAFKSTLDSNNDDTEAARNVEIVRKMIRDVEEQQKQQEQQKNQQKQDQNKQGQDQQSKDQNQDEQGQDGKQDQSQQSGGKNQQSQQHQQNADKLKDLSKQQSQAADKSKDASQQQDEQQRSEKSRQADAAQDNVNEQTKQQAEQQQASKQAQEQMEKAQQEQQAASEALDKGDTKKAEDHQRRAAEHLDEAAKAEQQAADEARQAEQKEKDTKDQKGKDGKEGKPKDDKPKYDQTASQLLDKERRERDARQQILRALRGKPQPVEKDW